MSLNLFDTVASAANVSLCGTYRYDLERRWNPDPVLVNFVMLNPSTADASEDDPTIRRCIGFAKAWGFGGLVVTNLFAYRSTDPKRLSLAYDPVGPRNNAAIEHWAKKAEMVVCAWGARGYLLDRDREVRLILRDHRPYHLGLTAAGHPKHPLYLPKTLTPNPWNERTP